MDFERVPFYNIPDLTGFQVNSINSKNLAQTLCRILNSSHSRIKIGLKDKSPRLLKILINRQKSEIWNAIAILKEQLSRSTVKN